jgi:hypothetical protein
MSDITKTTAESSDDNKYFLEEQELWDNLGFDWEGWNASVEKILYQQSVMNSNKQD